MVVVNSVTFVLRVHRHHCPRQFCWSDSRWWLCCNRLYCVWQDCDNLRTQMINYQYFRVFSAPRGWTKWNSKPSFQTSGFSNRVYCWTNGVWEKCSCFLPSVSTWNSRLQSMCATGESIQHSCHCQITKFWSDRQFFPVARKDIYVTWKTHSPQGSAWTDFHGAREGSLLYRDRDGQT